MMLDLLGLSDAKNSQGAGPRSWTAMGRSTYIVELVKPLRKKGGGFDMFWMALKIVFKCVQTLH